MSDMTNSSLMLDKQSGTSVKRIATCILPTPCVFPANVAVTLAGPPQRKCCNKTASLPYLNMLEPYHEAFENPHCDTQTGKAAVQRETSPESALERLGTRKAGEKSDADVHRPVACSLVCEERFSVSTTWLRSRKRWRELKSG